MHKKKLLFPKAVELWEQGTKTTAMVSLLGVSQATLIRWKRIYKYEKWKNSNIDLNKKSVVYWLEEQIQDTMIQIGKKDSKVDLLGRLDKLISMRKKYESSIDKLGETIRVMGDFANFVREFFPHNVGIVKEIANAFLRDRE